MEPSKGADGERGELLHQGRFLELRSIDGWEYVSRANARAVVAILAITEAREVLIVEQFRPPLGKAVLEIPAGLAGDDPYKKDEPLLSAAKRELTEETGFEARKWWSLMDGPTSAGLTDEVITFFLATQLTRVREVERHGVGGEDIRLHLVRIAEVHDFIQRKQETGVTADFKIHAALWAAQRHPMYPA